MNAHDKPQAIGFDVGVIRGLVATDWIRNVARTLAFLLLLVA